MTISMLMSGVPGGTSSTAASGGPAGTSTASDDGSGGFGAVLDAVVGAPGEATPAPDGTTPAPGASELRAVLAVGVGGTVPDGDAAATEETEPAAAEALAGDSAAADGGAPTDGAARGPDGSAPAAAGTAGTESTAAAAPQATAPQATATQATATQATATQATATQATGTGPAAATAHTQPSAPVPAPTPVATEPAAVTSAGHTPDEAGSDAAGSRPDQRAVTPAPNPDATARADVAVPGLHGQVGGPTAPTEKSTAPTPSLAPQLTDQLSAALPRLRTAGLGEHVLTLRVDPQTFGPIRVVAHIGADAVRIELVGASDAAREALRMALPDLRRDLVGTGLAAHLDLGSGDARDARGARDGLDGRGQGADDTTGRPARTTDRDPPGEGSARPAPGDAPGTTTHPYGATRTHRLDLFA